MAALLAAIGIGCSGINSGYSVSPATFLVPGLMKAEPPASSTNQMDHVRPLNESTALARK
jgi:hypothetical protein